MKYSIILLPVLALAVLAFGVGQSPESPASDSWLIVASENAPADRVLSALSAVGAIETRELEGISVFVANSNREDFATAAAAIPGVEGVARNRRILTVSGANADFGLAVVGPDHDGKTTPASHWDDDDFIAFLQWGLEAVHAPEAWSAGYRGKGVRVAVLDTGIDGTHIDLASNVNLSLSKSFVSGELVTDVTPGFPGAHGTHVAGIIAAPDNAIGVIGVAPEAEIVAVKVLSAVDGFGTFAGVIEGIIYAADIDADVINMSLGGWVDRRGGYDDNGTADPTDDIFFSASEVAALINATQRAIDYANKAGATVIASAGNEGIDADHAKDLVILPAGLANILSISATGPVGWGPVAPRDPDADWDALAFYSNHGQSEIDLAAPGGSADLTFPANWFYDLVISTTPGNNWAWAGGTSMAAPHVAGVAALIIEKNGGSMKPTHVETALRRSADDLGKPGRDDHYGHGRVNAEEAVE